MLTKLFGKKSDHPMSDLKSAQSLLDALPKDDDYQSLLELTDWLESVTACTTFKLDHQLALLCMIDEAACVHTRKLTREYFVGHGVSQFQENRLWLLLGNWYHHARQGYYHVFQRYCDGEKSSATLKAKLPLLVARTLRTMALELKYICVRYGAVDRGYWARLGKLYKHAEREFYLDTSVTLYAAQSQPSSVKLEAGNLLAWYGCGVSSLTPLGMHLTERIIAQNQALVSIHTQPSSQSLLGFDLNGATPPQRVNVDATLYPHMRFIGLATMSFTLEKFLKTLEKGIVPDELRLLGDYDANLVQPAVQHLDTFITTLPQRRVSRQAMSVSIKVVSGYSKIVDTADAALDFRPSKAVEWQIKDMSSIGFHAILPQQSSREVSIGQLLGVQVDGVKHWGVAVVRRLMRGENQQIHVGAEIISNQIACVSLQMNGAGVAMEQQALWLYPKIGEDNGLEINLLMKSDVYHDNCSYQTELAGKQLLLLPQGVLQRNMDCDLVLFRVVEQQTADTEDQ